MGVPAVRSLEARIPTVFAEFLGVDRKSLHLKSHWNDVDMLIQAEGRSFAVELKATANAPSVQAAAQAVKRAVRQSPRRVVPVVCVPHMGDVGQAICERENVSWFDLSGNGHVTAPGLRVIISGRPNRFVQSGRPRDLFAPRRLRVVRHLLIESKPTTQTAIAAATQLGKGYVSRIISELANEGFVRREGNQVLVPDSALLLDAWREGASFDRHSVRRGHVASRSGEALLTAVSRGLEGLSHAATGLAAAWQFTHFAAFRIVTVYLAEEPTPQQLEQMGFRDEPRGGNVWFVLPNDRGVFEGVREVDSVPCVHPVQVYIDLKDHPERSAEAAEALRQRVLKLSHAPQTTARE